ncbi:hypothetical protein OnM2_074037 [Erysiphe neolycopersici]|uniref:Uncharacterized protein n=1 Tax=Erysiphe neolycopersici TaxID=212602 RepID=A0A420HJ04_9PEZI|nr:hypothetical protein OnM2_074037 [Erysiphe neolycopersici]
MKSSGKLDSVTKPTSLNDLQPQRRENSVPRASILGLEQDKGAHPSIFDNSTKLLENIEKFPINRMPHVRQMKKDDAEVVENWVDNTGGTLAPGIPNLVCRERVLRLLYTYRYINARELERIEPTDLFEHKIRLKKGVEPWKRSHQRR